MEHSPINPNSRPDDRTRPLWARAVMLAAIWTMVLQPAVSSAQLSQSPMFTVTSAPPNVMLMFDDSASMNRLDLNPPPAYANSNRQSSGDPLATNPDPQAQYGRLLRYQRHALVQGRQSLRTTTTGNSAMRTRLRGRPRSIRLRITRRFSIYRGTTTEFVFPFLPSAAPPTSPVGALTEWDPRNLPPSMGGGTVFSKLALPRAGVIDGNGETRSWAAPVAGSVSYTGIPGHASLAGRRIGFIQLDDSVRQPQLRRNCAGPNDLRLVLPRRNSVGLTARSVRLRAMMEWPLRRAANVASRQVNTPTFTPAVGHRLQYFTTPLPPGPPYPAMTGPLAKCARRLSPPEPPARRPVRRARCPRSSATTRRTKWCAARWEPRRVASTVNTIRRPCTPRRYARPTPRINGTARTTTRSSRTTTAVRPRPRSSAEALRAHSFAPVRRR